MSHRTWRVFLALGALASMHVVVVPAGWLSTGMYDGIGLAAVTAITVGAVRNRSPARPTWLLLAAGNLLFVIGDYLFSLYEQLWGQIPFPSLADALYLVGYVPQAAGLILLIRRRTPGRDRAALTDAAIIASGLGLLSWVFLIKPAASDDSLTTLGRVISIAYPAADILLLVLLARLLAGTGVRNAAFRLLAAGMALVLVADLAYALMAQAGTYSDTNLVNVGWLLAYVCYGAAALHPSMRELSRRAKQPSRRLGRLRLTLLTGASLVAPVLLLVQAYEGAGVDAVAIGAGSIALFLLVVTRMAGLIRQVEEQAAQLERLAGHDGLTGVANRRTWDLALPLELERARREAVPLAVAMLDLDHFKRFNDEYGHQAGDQLLKAAVAVWQALVRPGDLLARYGGEEFTVLLPGAGQERALAVVERLRQATPLAQTVSAGVACWDKAESAEALLARADLALYQAKRNGRNRVVAAPVAAAPQRLAASSPSSRRLASGPPA
jgi:diguanylate cyclase (GGDEF)-like protein